MWYNVSVPLKLGANPKHLRSVLNYFQSGSTSRADFALGIEIEHFICGKNGEFVPYSGENGVEEILSALKDKFSDIGYANGKNEHLIALDREKLSISLEPGAQFETAFGPFKTPAELKPEYAKLMQELEPELQKRGLQIVAQSYHPTALKDKVTLIPKPRYVVMNEWYAKNGVCGQNMMRCSASTQVSFDFANESDAIKKLRVASALGPIFELMFENSPVFEGKFLKPHSMVRNQLWQGSDAHRSGTIPNLFDADFSFEKYAEYALLTPLMVVDFTHTPEFIGNNPVQIAHKCATDLYPDRELNTYEIEHILSTYFFDVRLKNFIELRTVDSLPIDRVVKFTELVAANFYNQNKLDFWADTFAGLKVADIKNAKDNLRESGEDAEIYSRPYSEWVKFLTNWHHN